jgi:hypothetical protein
MTPHGDTTIRNQEVGGVGVGVQRVAVTTVPARSRSANSGTQAR